MNTKLGIIGGGQLGKMLIQYCNNIDLKTYIYDENEDNPCKNICYEQHIGKLNDYDELIKFGKKCNIITYETEHININALKELEKQKIKVYPPSYTLELIQNKYTQKCFFINNSLPTGNFNFFNNLQEVSYNILNNKIKLPCVWKKTTLGYDGYGVKIIKKISDLANLEDGECIIEDYIQIYKEISVIVARNISGEFKHYPPLEMIFNKDSNQIEYVLGPAELKENIIYDLIKISEKVSTYTKHIGILAIEYFITIDGKILINELAPRPHNSGHLTIETCCPTSQFEQHIRAILNLSLGETYFTEKAIMINLVGEEKQQNHNRVIYDNIEYVFNSKNTYLHIYGKKTSKVNRKMGHITIVGNDNLMERAINLKKLVKIS